MPAALMPTNHPTYLRRLAREINGMLRNGSDTVYARGASNAHRVARVAYGPARDVFKVWLLDGDFMAYNGSEAAAKFFTGTGDNVCASREV